VGEDLTPGICGNILVDDFLRYRIFQSSILEWEQIPLLLF
jgi:hypothetical protein